MRKKSPLPASTLSSPWFFFLLTFAWTWGFWVPTALSGRGVTTTLGAMGFALGGFGPMLAGIGCSYANRGTAGWREYWERVIDPRRIEVPWFAVILLFIPLLTALAASLDIFSGGSGAAWEPAAAQFALQPAAIIPFALYLFFAGPFVEELGWRGYVLDRLLTRWNALMSSLILGVIWALWHLPLFFIQGTYQYNQGLLSQSFWLFAANIISSAVLITWIFNNNQRSTLAAMLFHFMVNLTGELIAATPRTDVYATVLWVLAAGIVIAVWGTKTLVRTPLR
jgi:membrane protease YdiL (CAAX protease family)